ncbi:GNAT family N-acetyltransferase [Paenibacillus glycanilyticus]|uniref:GNAT family N-acetyltransferase n=1 Tax=Paenibacillus glycanilyticus TaxID=126569 RepID=UPI00203E05F5|nr:GNAT family N-acetyltransferase [Paenibacillus glycanilyticus]MCM3627117.1 GNAT family N-acetyltransferase [Paenibacillus glycanilyticus]
MEKNNEIIILPSLTDSDHEWLRELWVREWGGETVISKGKEHHFKDLNIVIAWIDGKRVGAATYRIEANESELTSINSTAGDLGIESKLITAVEQTVKKSGVNRFWLITTNDNIDALRFYQKRGYRVIAIYPNAVIESRKLKPAIPLLGNYNIPIQDEIELEKYI